MSWPSAYGYKYTPIGLRQREKKDDASGTRSICTTVHLPQGGHLLDIERQYGIDGSMSKRETQNMEPSAVPPVTRPPIRASSPIFGGDFDPHAYEPRSFAPSDFERQADDIIANFRARQGLPLEDAREAIQYLDDTYGKLSNTLRKESANHFLSWGYLGGKPGQQFVSSLDY
ncbi:uncharacterized protein [Procambarus clarkii]|uniref:uncharacterized protein isoform X2 n=1 Tax=Procambarus clarkii TaxID=6728 RepID=UPI001E675F59|nr:uncharacterized protein LOC123757471 isoform X2 [Procambarus clarkii]